jgi:hypothetical protein
MFGTLETTQQMAYHFNDFSRQPFEEVTSQQQFSNSINLT